MRFLLPASLLLSLVCARAADPVADSVAFDHFYNLEYDEALREFEKEVRANPGDPAGHNHVAQALLFREMHRVGALESEMVSGNNSFLRRPKMNPPEEVERYFSAEVEKALSLGQARVAANPKDIAAYYALGVAHGVRANYNYLVRKAWMDALRDASQAGKMHARVTELDPSNHDARLLQGMVSYLVGSLPTFYRLLSFFTSFHGDREGGIRILKDVARNGRYNRVDAEVFLCALYRRENRPEDALPLLEDLVRRYPRNYIFRFEQSQMYGIAGDKAKALGAVEEIASRKQRNEPGFTRVTWDKIHYQLGNIQFWYRDYAPAIENLNKVLAAGDQVDLNTGALARMRLGQIYDLTNRRQDALRAYQQAVSFAPQAEAAQESKKYLSSPYRRQKLS